MNKKAMWILMVAVYGSFLFTCGKAEPFRIVLLSGADEYYSALSLEKYKKYLEATVENVQVTLLRAGGELNSRGGFSDVPGLEALDDCDAALFFTSRLSLDGEQLEMVKRYVSSGKPVVAVRTAGNGFLNWPEFGTRVLGGSFHGHYEGSPEPPVTGAGGDLIPDPAGVITGFTQEVLTEPGAKTHPVLHGVTRFSSRYSLYKTSPVAKDATVLMRGTIPDSSGDTRNGNDIYYGDDEYVTEPAVWTRTFNGGRVCYIAPGGLQDWDNSTFRRLVTNALFWTAGREPTMIAPPPPKLRPQQEGTIHLSMRSREETDTGNGIWREVTIEKDLKRAETAVIITDMWDKHWCSAAELRTGALAVTMNPVLKKAREKGIQIIHAPSGTMHYYADFPQRRRMMLAPDATPPSPPMHPDSLDSFTANPKPIDDYDECDSEGDRGYGAWTKENSLIEIGEYDGISDRRDEIYNFIQQLGIKNIIYMGVHANFCLLNRTFALRQMAAWGINVILVRDLTDAMYDPKNYPHVSHDEGTDLVIQFIEKYYAPTILSRDLVAALK